MTRPYSSRNGLTPDRVAALAVALAPLVYFLPAVRGALVISPDDGVIFNVPLRVAAARVALAGSLPLWNPYLFCGMPLHGTSQGGLLFPLNWFYLVFSTPVATNLMMLSTYSVAALGAYLCARRGGADVTGAVLTSLVWQWSAFLNGQIGHTNILQTAAMLPWVLWAVDVYGATGGRGRGVLLAALVALQAFTGHQQTFAYALLLAAAYCIVMACAGKRTRAAYLRSLVFVVAGVLLSAVQILPTFELLRNSPRAEATYEFFTSFSMPRRFVLTFFAPYLNGGGDGSLFRAPYVGPPFFAEYVGYVGALTIMLALLAVWLRPDARTKFWAVTAFVCLALALGRYAPLGLYELIYYVPVLNLFRVPARHLMEVEFALAILAGRGLSAVASARGDARVVRRAVFAGLSVLLLTWLAVTWLRPEEFRLGRQATAVSVLRAPELFLPLLFAALGAWALWEYARGRRRGASALLLAVLALDLFVWGQSSGWRVASPKADFELWGEPATVRYLREREARHEGETKPYRILTEDQPFDPDYPVGVPSHTGRWVPSLQPDVYMMYGVENAAGYDGFGLARYSRLAGDMKVWGELTDAERTLRGEGRELDLLNVRYLLTRPLSADAGAASAAAAPAFPEAAQAYGGQGFAAEDLGMPSLGAGQRLSFGVPPVGADRFALLTNLSWSVDVPDGTTVARVRLRAEGGRTFDFELRAGEHTSEWAYDRADIRAHVRHRRAPLATSYAVEDAQGRYEGHTYVAAFALPEKATVTGGEITVERLERAPELSLSVLRISLADVAGGQSFPLRREWLKKESATASQTPSASRGEGTVGPRWRRLALLGEVAVFENTRALPRAWLANGTRALDERQTLDAIRTGRLPEGRAWEPGRTALVEAAPGSNEAPPDANSDSEGGAQGSAKVTRHEPNRVEVETASAAPSILVLSENYYPGWRAYVDGRAAETLRVDYNLRGVSLPSGEHVVEFVYRPKSVLAGFLISLLVSAALLLWWKRLLPEAPVRRLTSRLLQRRDRLHE
jgi:hypothetical protein